MSEAKEVVGQITINFPAKGRPEVVVKGQINPRLVPGLTRSIQVAYRQYQHSLSRAKKRVDMADKGKVQEGAQEAVPAPDATNNLFDVPKKEAPAPTEELVVEDALAEDEATPAETEKAEGTADTPVADAPPVSNQYAVED